MTTITSATGLVHDDLLGADVPPVRLVTRMIGGTMVSRALYAACKLGVPDACAGGGRSVDEIAAACGTDGPALGRYLRLLAASGLFAEDDEGRFSLTDLGQLLRRDVPGTLAPFAVLAGELLEPTAESALYALRTGRSAFVRTHGCALYEHLAGVPDVEALFAEAMSARAAHLHAALIAALDWDGVRHVVDVGGNHGAFLAAVLRQRPEATGVLLDQPHVVAGAGPLLTAAGVADRVDVEPGDFFVAVPPGGDVYLVANVLWNWPDSEALQILRRCRESMASTARIAICEPVVPPGNHPHPAKNLDMVNFWLNGGGARSSGQWRSLLARAGFEPVGIVETEVAWAVVEARPRLAS
jgi:hypothetical protein